MRLRNKKTGEVIEYDRVLFRKPTSIGHEDYYPDVSSLAELHEDWEDYKLAEPLIKDEKIRKAVRAWAEANDYPKTMGLYYNAPNFVLRADISTIEFDKEIEPLQHGDEYTIADLCGEEGE